MSLPSATTRLQDQGGTAAVSTDLLAIWAAVPDGDDGVPVVYSSLAALIDEKGYSEGAELAGLHIKDTGKPVMLVPLPIATAGVIGRQKSLHTGTSKVTAAVGADGALLGIGGAAPAVFQVVRGGTVGTDEIILQYSLDGETSWKTARLGTATSYVIPRIGVTASFGIGTLVTGDTILEFETTAPLFDASGVATGGTAMAAQMKTVRSWLFVGDVATGALGQAIESEVNAYETSTERFVLAKFQARDRRIVKSSQQRSAMVGGSAVTFLEVGATGDTITRADGSFVTDGFQVGDYIRVTGAVATAGANNVSGKITGVTATVLTLDTADLINEGPITTAAITTEPTFTFASAGDTITRNRGSWISDGFALGDTVTVSGTASNDGTHIITTLTATVMTFAGSALVDEVAGSATALVSLTETVTAWKAATTSTFSAISSSERVDIGRGRLTKASTITGFSMRWPTQWADSIRSYQNDLSIATWWKDLGALDGWGIEGEYDARVDGGIEDRFTCARTWANGPDGAFIAQAFTRATDGSILGYTHNMHVANLVQTVVQRTTERFTGQSLVLNADGTAKTESLADLRAKVQSELDRNVMVNVPSVGPRASSVTFNPATDDDLSVVGATLNTSTELNFKGTIVHINNVIEVS